MITVTMLKVVFVLGCLLSLTLAHPVSVTFSYSIPKVFLYVEIITIFKYHAVNIKLATCEFFYRWTWSTNDLLGLALTPMR